MSAATRTHRQEVDDPATLAENFNNAEGIWQNLLRWLQSKGMDTSKVLVKPISRPESGRGLVAIGDIQPSSTIISIPHPALLNSRTLHALYPFLPLEGLTPTFEPSYNIAALNGTQLLTIHLCLHRPDGCKVSPDPHHGPYISTLPEDFDSHPLTWLMKERGTLASAEETRLLKLLTPGTRSRLNAVADRLVSDRKVIFWYKERYASELHPSHKINDRNIVWAWLIVNTRCLYLRLFPEDLPMSNLTLSPLVDFANHPSSAESLLLQPPAPSKVFPKSKYSTERDKFVFQSPKEFTPVGEEVYLKYGDHSNVTLFTEYGFVDNREHSDGEVDVSDLAHELIRGMGEDGERVKQFIEDQGCSENMRLYGTPEPAYPSWSLLVVLRILGDTVLSKTSSTCPPGDDANSRRLEILSGHYSRACEESAREQLAVMCMTIIKRAHEIIAVIERERDRQTQLVSAPWFRWSLDCIQTLWREEVVVALAVLRNVENGVEY